MARRFSAPYQSEPVSSLATWARNLAVFSVVAVLVSIAIVRFGFLEVKPALATLGIFVFIYHWNEFIWTMTITRTAPELQTVPVGIYLMRGAYDNPEDRAFLQAALAVSTVPLALLFLSLQRFYVRGLVMSGIKG